MDIERAKILRPVAEPRVIERVYTDDQHERLLNVARKHAPWPLIVAHHFKSGEELLATTSGTLPEGVEPTIEMYMTPVFRGFLSYNKVCLYPEIQDCFHNPSLLDLVRDYWGAAYAEPDSMLFNIQGPCPGGSSPHVDATRFRGITLDNTPVWLMNIMVKSGLFKHWQARKAQVIAWYYRGSIGGGFNYWPNGPHGQPKQIRAPMWGRAAVVENEMMFHTAEACGPASERMPAGLAFNSLVEPDPECEGGWCITTNGKLIQRIPEIEIRFLVHWGSTLYMNLDELKTAVDRTDDITHDQVFDILLGDLGRRGVPFETPSDPLKDKRFIALLNDVYGVEKPLYYPPEPEEGITA